MVTSRNRHTTSLRDSDSRLGESDRIEGTGSWDAIEWTTTDQPVSRPVPMDYLIFCLKLRRLSFRSFYSITKDNSKKTFNIRCADSKVYTKDDLKSSPILRMDLHMGKIWLSVMSAIGEEQICALKDIGPK
ncbi:hypothetical protein L1987_75186 [Smallanthus sonchifolius]|uniref:Uncharacterized protein n=1 Tax=Smallanthus sonchifolius TaxID=185202 RepID=A0ACB9A5D4_9ASTR|nr:hypothetical protein L1987_75186 [Smallanthus sonchifolius]